MDVLEKVFDDDEELPGMPQTETDAPIKEEVSYDIGLIAMLKKEKKLGWHMVVVRMMTTTIM